MNKREYLEELKAHDWTYEYASGDAYYKGRDNQQRLSGIANSNNELKALWDAYTAYVWSGGEMPTIEEKATANKAEAAQPTYNHKMVMLDAWRIARKGAKRFGGSSKLYLAASLRQAWARAKAFLLCSHSDTTPSKVFYICMDEKTTSNTRIINQPVLETVFTKQEEALAALEILSNAFTKPFIKTSRYFHL